MTLPIAISRLDGKSGSGTSLTSNSITPGDNTVVMGYFFSRKSGTGPTTPTITGGGLTWHTEANNAYSIFGVVTGRHVVAWANTGTGSGTFTVKADYGATSHTIFIVLDKAANAHPSAAVVQAKYAASASSAAISTLGFASVMTRGNAVWAGIGWLSDTETLTAGDGYTLLTPSVTATSIGTAQTEWRADIDTNAEGLLSAAAPWGITGVEIQAAPDPSQIVGGTSVRHYDDSGVTYYEPLNIRRYSQGDVRRYDQ